MPKPIVIRPVKSLTANTLDFRGVKKYGHELVESVMKSIEATQRPIMNELPDMLVLSHKQFASLVPPERAYFTKDQLFHTPLNSMDVYVDTEVEPLPAQVASD